MMPEMVVLISSCRIVQFIGVRLGCCRPGTGPIFHRWSDCPHVDSFQDLGVFYQCVPDSYFRTASFLVPFVFMSFMCGFNERRVSNFTTRKVGVSTWAMFLSPSFIATVFFRWKGKKTVDYLHFTDLKSPVVCPPLYLVHSFLDSVSRRCGVFRCIPHDEIICM